MSPRSFSSAVFALVVLLGTASASAAEPEPRLAVDLEYRADPALRDCPVEEAFRDSIRVQVGYEPFREGARHRLHASFGPARPGIRGKLIWHDESGQVRGERELYLDTEDCPAFTRMLGFAIVVQLDLFSQEPELSQPIPASTQDADPGTGANSVPLAKETLADDDSTDAGTTVGAGWQIAIGAGPIAGIGFTSAPALGGRAFLNAGSQLLALEVGGEASVPSRNSTVGDEGYEERLILGSLAGCVEATPVSGCLVGKAGVLQVHGFGVDISRSASGLVAQLGPRISLTQPLGSGWTASMRVELLANLVPSAVLLDRQEVWKTPAAGVSVGLDLIAVIRDNSQPGWTIPTSR